MSHHLFLPSAASTQGFLEPDIQGVISLALCPYVPPRLLLFPLLSLFGAQHAPSLLSPLLPRICFSLFATTPFFDPLTVVRDKTPPVFLDLDAAEHI